MYRRMMKNLEGRVPSRFGMMLMMMLMSMLMFIAGRPEIGKKPFESGGDRRNAQMRATC